MRPPQQALSLTSHATRHRAAGCKTTHCDNRFWRVPEQWFFAVGRALLPSALEPTCTPASDTAQALIAPSSTVTSKLDCTGCHRALTHTKQHDAFFT